MINKTNLNYSEGEHYILLDQHKAPEIYVDGISDLLMGFPTTKLLFHTVLDLKDNEKEIRRANVLLTMDTNTAISTALEIITSFKSSEQAMHMMAESNLPAKLKALLESIPNEFNRQDKNEIAQNEKIKVKRKAKSVSE